MHAISERSEEMVRAGVSFCGLQPSEMKKENDDEAGEFFMELVPATITMK